MSAYDVYKTDAALEKDGVWLDFGTFEIKCARAGGKNEPFTKRLEKELKPHQRVIEVGMFTETKAVEALAKVYADCIILGWRTKQEDGSFVPTIEGPDGMPLEYTRENVIGFLVELPDLFATIRAQAQDWQNYRANLRKAVAGN